MPLRPLIHYEVAAVLLPAMLGGNSLGIVVSRVVAPTLLVVLSLVLLLMTSCKTFYKGVKAYREQSRKSGTGSISLQRTFLNFDLHPRSQSVCSDSVLHGRNACPRVGGRLQSSFSPPEPPLHKLPMRIPWKSVLFMIAFNFIFCADYLIMAPDVSGVERCSAIYWIALLGLYPIVAASVLVAVRFMRHLDDWHQQRGDGTIEGDPTIGRNAVMAMPLLATAVGLLAGLLGLGGGEFLVPLLLEFGTHPRVAAATSGFLIFFNTSSNVAHYLLAGTIEPFLAYGVGCFLFAPALRQFQHREDVEAHAQASLDFLQGPRRFRQKFGSAIEGTDYRTDDLVMDEIVRFRQEALFFGASLRRQATAARAWTAEDPAERSALRRTRQEAAEMIEECDWVLERCRDCGWINSKVALPADSPLHAKPEGDEAAQRRALALYRQAHSILNELPLEEVCSDYRVLEALLRVLMLLGQPYLAMQEAAEALRLPSPAAVGGAAVPTKIAEAQRLQAKAVLTMEQANEMYYADESEHSLILRAARRGLVGLSAANLAKEADLKAPSAPSFNADLWAWSLLSPSCQASQRVRQALPFRKQVGTAVIRADAAPLRAGPRAAQGPEIRPTGGKSSRLPGLSTRCAARGRMDNIWKAHSPSRLGDGAEVLAPDKEHWLHRGQIVDEYAEGQTLPPGYRVVELRSGKAFALPEARLVPWRGYPQRLLAGCQGSGKQTPDLPCAVWRCEIWTEGLFSLLFWALGWLETEAAASSQATNLLIDWTDPRILLHGGGERYANNAWNHFFEQPAEEGLSMQSLEAAEDNGRLKIVVRFGMPWFKKFGEFRGADEGNGDLQGIRGGRLDQAAAWAGREAMRRWIRVRPNIRQRVEAWCDAQQDVARSLAVHIRRTDKLEQCRSNQWSEKELAMQIRAFCSSLALPCVFLCSDDVSLKRQLARQLGRDGLRVLSFEALLSSGGLPSHKDEKLDRRQNAEDVLVEVLIMSRCAALLSTYSNVSVAAIYFSEPGFPFFMFGDSLPEGSRAAPVASYGGFRSSLACYCRVACRVRAWQSRRRRCGRQPAFESLTKKMQLSTSETLNPKSAEGFRD
ncbi:unnamed protein product [Symbiodinium microadriaticum]|nr:unnamed protein product [Symbiodinium microadriaticum]